jgi:hypothetical protein
VRSDGWTGWTGFGRLATCKFLDEGREGRARSLRFRSSGNGIGTGSSRDRHWLAGLGLSLWWGTDPNSASRQLELHCKRKDIRLEYGHRRPFPTGRTTPFFVGLCSPSEALHTLGQSSESTLFLNHWREKLDIIFGTDIDRVHHVGWGKQSGIELIVDIVRGGGS